MRGLRAKFVAVHGARAVAKAESVALFRLALLVLERATARRWSAERAFARAKEEAEEMPPDWRKDDPLRPWCGAWLPYTWGALERFADAARTEAEWMQRCADLAEVVARDHDAARSAAIRATHRSGWLEQGGVDGG